MFKGDSSHLPSTPNSAGVIPPIFASSLLLLPITMANFSSGQGPDWLNSITAMLGLGQPLHIILYVAMIVFFAFFYTAVRSEEHTSELQSLRHLVCRLLLEKK